MSGDVVTPVINAFTVDLEDWFQGLTSTNPRVKDWNQYEPRLEASTLHLLALLERHGVRATFFVLGDVATNYPDLIRHIEAQGHAIGVHGYWHRRVDRLDATTFLLEIDRALEAICPLVASPVIGHRAPYFSINHESRWALDLLAERGFHYDSSVFPTKSTLYGYPQAPRFPYRPSQHGSMWELPISTAAWLGLRWPIGGGFYLRALPYSLVRAAIRQINRARQPAILYMHPWELDTGQRYDRVTLRERVTHYHGRGALQAKLETLFAEFSFGPMPSVIEQIEGAEKDNAYRRDA